MGIMLKIQTRRKKMSFIVLVLTLLPFMLQGQLIPNKSNPKTINVNAPLGTKYQNHKRSVCIINVEPSSRIFNPWGKNCTATLLNTVNQNGKYYLLTAAHCLSEESPVVVNDDVFCDNINTSYPEIGSDLNISISFNYESLSASARVETGVALVTQKIKAKLRQIIPDFDLALLEVTSTSYEDVLDNNLYFSGWSLDWSPPEALVAHPEIDLKKIYKALSTPIMKKTFCNEGSTFISTWGIESFVDMDNIQTESGTSGAGYINRDNKIVAMHTGKQGGKTKGVPINHGWINAADESPLFQKYLDSEFTYASKVFGGYGMEKGAYKISSDDFNITLSPATSFKTPDIGTDGNTDQMVKLNLWKLNNSLSNTQHRGGIYRVRGEINFKMTTYVNGSPILLYSIFADGDALQSQTKFEEQIISNFDESILQEISAARGIESVDQLNEFAYDLPVVIEIKNTSDAVSEVRALKIPGLGYRNSVEIFQPQQFEDLYSNADYTESRGNSSELSHIHKLSVKVSGRGSTKTVDFQTEDNGGYVNLIQHNFPSIQLGDEVELSFTPNDDNSGVAYYRAWIDYNRDRRFDGLDEMVIANLSGSYGEISTASFSLPENLAIPQEGIRTRIRIAVRHNRKPPADGFRNYEMGETEDYTVNIYRNNDNRQVISATNLVVDEIAGVHIMKKGDKCARIKSGKLTWLDLYDPQGNPGYLACDQVKFEKVTNDDDDNRYIVSLNNGKHHLDIDVKKSKSMVNLGDFSFVTTDMKVEESFEPHMKLYSFSSDDEELYAFEYEFNEDISLPYEIIPFDFFENENLGENGNHSLNIGEPSKSANHTNTFGIVAGTGITLVGGLSILGGIYKIRGNIKNLFSRSRYENIPLRESTEEERAARARLLSQGKGCYQK